MVENILCFCELAKATVSGLKNVYLYKSADIFKALA